MIERYLMEAHTKLIAARNHARKDGWPAQDQLKLIELEKQCLAMRNHEQQLRRRSTCSTQS